MGAPNFQKVKNKKYTDTKRFGARPELPKSEKIKNTQTPSVSEPAPNFQKVNKSKIHRHQAFRSPPRTSKKWKNQKYTDTKRFGARPELPKNEKNKNTLTPSVSEPAPSFQ